MMEPETFRDCVDAIESAYEVMLAYAAQGRATEGGDIRSYLESLSSGLGVVGDAVVGEIEKADGKNTNPMMHYAAVLAADASRAKAAVDMTLATPSIGSQIIDNLNATIHLRALLTSIFLIDEALKSAK